VGIAFTILTPLGAIALVLGCRIYRVRQRDPDGAGGACSLPFHVGDLRAHLQLPRAIRNALSGPGTLAVALNRLFGRNRRDGGENTDATVMRNTSYRSRLSPTQPTPPSPQPAGRSNATARKTRAAKPEKAAQPRRFFGKNELEEVLPAKKGGRTIKGESLFPTSFDDDDYTRITES
jgi:hypothetical protein